MLACQALDANFTHTLQYTQIDAGIVCKIHSYHKESFVLPLWPYYAKAAHELRGPAMPKLTLDLFA